MTMMRKHMGENTCETGYSNAGEEESYVMWSRTS